MAKSKRSGSMIYATEAKRSKKKLDKGQLKDGGGSLLGTVFWLGLAGTLVYASLFYVGAFVDIGKIVGVSSKTMDLDDGPQGVRRLTAPISHVSQYKRIYLRKDQAIGIEYSLPQGAELDLRVLQCANRPVIEVFDCKPIGERVLSIRGKEEGSSTIYVSEPGFYYFADKVTLPGGTPARRGKKYDIVWRRV